MPLYVRVPDEATIDLRSINLVSRDRWYEIIRRDERTRTRFGFYFITDNGREEFAYSHLSGHFDPPADWVIEERAEEDHWTTDIQSPPIQSPPIGIYPTPMWTTQNNWNVPPVTPVNRPELRYMPFPDYNYFYGNPLANTFTISNEEVTMPTSIFKEVAETKPLVFAPTLETIFKYKHKNYTIDHKIWSKLYKSYRKSVHYHVNMEDFLYEMRREVGRTLNNHDCLLFDIATTLFAMSPSKEHIGKIALYQDRDKWRRKIKTALKPGKALKLLFPHLDDKTIAYWANEWKEIFVEQDLVFETGESREWFAKVYGANRANMCDLKQTSSMKKSLSNSCMSGKWDESAHPAEMYASGDFICAAVWEGEKVAARTILYKKNMSHSPIYTNTETAYEELKSKIRAMGYVSPSHVDCGDWRGAKLLAIPIQGENSLVTAYVDFEPRLAMWEHGEDYMYIHNEGNVALYNTQGWSPTVVMCTCDWCNDEAQENHTTYLDQYGNVCDHCIENNFGYCDRRRRYVPNDELEEVLVRDGWGNYIWEIWSEIARSNYAVWCERAEICVASNIAVFLGDGEWADPREIETRCARCAINGEWYYKDEMVMCYLPSVTPHPPLLVYPDNIDTTLYYEDENGEWRWKTGEAA